jgi:hypothetical protein
MGLGASPSSMPRSNTACDLTIRDNAGLACFHDITPAQAAVHMSSYPKGVGEVLMNPAPLKLAGRPWENEDDLLSHVGQLRSIARQLWRIAEGFTKVWKMRPLPHWTTPCPTGRRTTAIQPRTASN